MKVGSGETSDWLRSIFSSHLHRDVGILAEVDSSCNPHLEQLISVDVIRVLRDVDLLGVPLGVLVGPRLELLSALPAHVPFLSAPVAPHRLRAVRHLVTLLLALTTMTTELLVTLTIFTFLKVELSRVVLHVRSLSLTRLVFLHLRCQLLKLSQKCSHLGLPSTIGRIPLSIIHPCQLANSSFHFRHLS